MVLANENGESGITSSDYREVIERAGLEEAFEEAWDSNVRDDRGEAGLGSVSETVIIEETIKADDDMWALAVSDHPVRYHIIPVSS